MRNYWKQFVGWVTGLRDDPFSQARFTLTFQTSITFIFMLLLSLLILLGTHTSIHRDLNTRFPSKVDAIFEQIEESAFQHRAILIFSIFAVGTLALSFFVSSKALSPIKNIVRAQKRFIADSSHELRTPLSIMKINAEVALMEGSKLTNKDAIETFRSNLEEIDRMSRLIENLLKLSYYDSKPIEIPFGKVDLNEIATNIVNKTKSLAAVKSIKISFSKIEKAVVWGNPTALEQMIMNLIKNAITYTQPGGQIFVSVKDMESTYQVNVRDTGVGISPKDLPHVFDPFYKAATDGNGKTNRASSGLGLTIVKKIAERHKASIGLKSCLGKGTTVSINLPKLAS